MRCLRSIRGLLAIVALTAGPRLALAQDATRLDADVPIWRDLVAGDAHHYTITLDSGRFAFIAVEQHGIDVIVRVRDPEGTEVAEVDSPNGTQGIEPVLLFTELDGDYRIEVSPLNEDAEPGRYAIGIERVEPVATTVAGRVHQVFAVWDRPGAPGASIGIMQDSEIIFATGYGEAQLEYGVPITPETVFHVASVSKQFTAFAVILLADRGLLSLDDDIREYLPEIHDFGPTITIRHLIHHVSGLRDQWDLVSMAGWRMDDVITRNQIMRVLERQRELNFEPGAEYLYCNSGYTLLAEIVSRVAGTPFPEFMREEVFKPLGMDRTHFHDDHEMVVPNRAYSYGSAPDGGFRKIVLSYANVGATSLFTTVGDALQWMENLDRGTVGGESVLELMHQRGVLNSGDTLSYAAGLSIGSYRGLTLIGHSGGDAGFRSYIGRFPDQGLAIAIFSNLGSFNPAEMARRVADIYLEGEVPEVPDQPAEEPAMVARAEVDPAIFDDYEGSYRFPSDLLVKVARDGDRLMVQPPGQSRVEMIPQSDSAFFVREISGVLRFRRERGEVTALDLVRGDVVETARRLPAFDPDTVMTGMYTGRYYSAELETAYSLIVEDGRLTAVHVHYNPVPLIPVGPDQYPLRGAQVRFARDPDGTVTGMRISSGRVRNLRFERVDW
jgi:CubicO group peptidase (beta-lactamase class C family)